MRDASRWRRVCVRRDGEGAEARREQLRQALRHRSTSLSATRMPSASIPEVAFNEIWSVSTPRVPDSRGPRDDLPPLGRSGPLIASPGTRPSRMRPARRRASGAFAPSLAPSAAHQRRPARHPGSALPTGSDRARWRGRRWHRLLCLDRFPRRKSSVPAACRASRILWFAPQALLIPRRLPIPSRWRSRCHSIPLSTISGNSEIPDSFQGLPRR